MSNEVIVAPETTTAVAKIDNGKPALYNPAAFDQIWRASKLFASSDLVPVAYKGKPENCFIAIEMADRMGINPFAMLQSLVIIQGKPSMEAKLIIALVNDSGMFTDPLEYEIDGDDPHAQNYRVRCFATMKKTGKACYGPWITYQMVKGEGWLDKGGSKWKTMPSIMFMYRAASFFAKVYCPNITMGMQTREEMEDIRQPIDVTPVIPALVAPLDAAPPVITHAPPVVTDTPDLVAPLTETLEAEVVDIETGEVTEAPPQETAEQTRTRTRRSKAQIEADKAAAQAPVTPVTDDDDSWPEPPPHPAEASGTAPAEPAPVAAVQTAPVEDIAPVSGDMGDLF